MTFIGIKDCRHDQGFTCMSTHTLDMPPAVWVCNVHCGRWLNFDPEHYLTSVALLPYANPEREWKDKVTLLDSGP